MVAAGILLSRLSGLVRQRVLSQFLGLSPAADAFNAAFRIPNFLQNLFGEGVLSASFIPAYARLRAEGREEDARRMAGAVFGAGSLLVAVVVALGVTLTPWLVSALFPGFHGSQRLLTIQLVRILFPGVGLLVLSAWCLSILNSHRKFFLSYAAPVVWNIAIIAATLAAGAGRPLETIVLWSAWGAVVGSALQFLVQLPVVLRLTPGLRVSLGRGDPHVGRVFATFLPAFVTRGVTQISAFIDGILASLLPSGAVTALANAQTLYSLPVSLFGMSISAAELPEFSAAAIGGESAHGMLRERLESASRRVAFFIVPTVVGFAALGEVIAAVLFQAGRFSAEDARYVWVILAGATIGLLATTQGRLYSSVFYALHDTKTPLRYAGLRVLLASALGYLAAIQLPPALGLEPRWGAAGITAATGLAGWLEFVLLRRSLSARIGRIHVAPGYLARLWGPAIVAGAVGWLIMRQVSDTLGPLPRAVLVLTPFGIIYLLGTALLNVPQARGLIDRVRRRA
jgi:putative peptidoglycan lipid II flippase